MRLIDGIPVWGTEVDEGALTQIKRTRQNEHVAAVAMMADHHKGYAVPIGGVVGYRNAISPSGVGFDIGCGNKAVLTDATLADVKSSISTIMDDVFSTISFGVGRRNDERVDHELFDHSAWSISAIAPFKEMARQQLGTVGSGNHYVDIFADTKDRIWVGVHFGSRGFGHKTATHFLEAAGATDGMDVDPCVISMDSQLGQDYVQCMTLAGLYAYAGRDWVCSRVAKILGAKVLTEIHNHHNYAWREVHTLPDGSQENLWVVRKGATPAFPDQLGFVGGSMGEPSVILKGKASDEGPLSLWSTIHGAGRVMGRMDAKGKIKNGVVVREPRVTQAMMDDWVSGAGVELRGAGVDESPHCYKRLSDVLTEHSDMVDIVETLTPIGVAMAGKHEFDPYKD